MATFFSSFFFLFLVQSSIVCYGHFWREASFSRILPNSPGRRFNEPGTDAQSGRLKFQANIYTLIIRHMCTVIIRSSCYTRPYHPRFFLSSVFHPSHFPHSSILHLSLRPSPGGGARSTPTASPLGPFVLRSSIDAKVNQAWLQVKTTRLQLSNIGRGEREEKMQQSPHFLILLLNFLYFFFSKNKRRD